MKSWKELDVWQKTHALVLRVYEVTAQFPAAERYRLTDQLCRAASSVSANIVEGQSRQTTREYLQFLYNACPVAMIGKDLFHGARGSLEETRYHLLLASDLHLLGANVYTELETGYESASKMLNGLIRALKHKEDGSIKG